MTDPLKIAAALAVFVLGTRAAAWGDTAPKTSKVFPYPVHETVLDNGLKVVAVPFDSPGLAAHWMVVRVGSRNEIEPGKSGFAHFFEHMMFRGTERYSREAYNAVLKELGADHNAFTSDDLTAYHVLAPASALERVIELEADRFMNLKYTEEDFKKEAGAVLGEYNKSAANPFLTLHERVRETAFASHTYRHTTIGFLRDIRDMPNQYAYSRTFFDRFYRPENCILLVVGDVEPKRVFAVAKSRFGPWKRGTHRFEVPAEPPQKEEKRTHVDWDTPTQPYLVVGYHAPAFSTTGREMPALDVVSQLLFAEAAPLYQRLVVEEQVVDLLFGGAEDHRDPYLFTIMARVKDPAKMVYVEQTIAAALQALHDAPVEADRLVRVRSHLKYAYAGGLDTAGSVARGLAHYLALTGDPGAVNKVYALYDQVTPEDVRRVAKSVFVPANRTVVTLSHKAPEAAGGGAPGAAR
ncbi:MAG: M16 family metallopeptidase [Candidatus Polarisedimenticolia bacterium]